MNALKTLALCLSAALFALAGGCGQTQPQISTTYGVFIGLEPEDASLLRDYRTVVIDAAYYSPEDIAALRQEGTKVYSYLNIGSIEDFRESFPSYKHLIFGDYADWPGEYWVDVSQQDWQQYIAREAEALAAKEVDGFFLDNADVYYQYPEPEIYRGLVAIIDQLGQYEKDIVVNGGDVFVTQALLEGGDSLPITGVNQECVFTGINFDTGVLTRQDPDTSQYYKAYLERCAQIGLEVYLTEYAPVGDTGLGRDIQRYCDENQFDFYIASSVNLDK